MKAKANPTCKCGKMFKRYTSLQKACMPCMVEKIRRDRILSDKRVDKAKKQASNEFRKKVLGNDLDHQHKLTRTQFNRMRVLEELKWFRDKAIEPYCISCRKTKMDFCCGHFKTVSSQGNLRYDRMNTYIQCNRACNCSLSGNVNGNKNSIGYKAGLILRFGKEEGQSIIDYCDTHTAPKKWYCDELIEFRSKCAAKVRELEKVIV